MKKTPLIISALLVMIMASITACQQSDEDVIIEGEVIEQNSGDPVQNALVVITSPQDIEGIRDRTDSLGQYRLDGFNVSEVTDIEITASSTSKNYQDQVRTLKVTPEDMVEEFDFELTEEGTDIGGGDEDDDEQVSGEARGAARLQMLNVSEEYINVRGTGGVENSTFTFVVKDSAGRAINSENAVEVQFNLIKSPGGGETILPERIETNAQGRVVGNLASGDSAGVVRIEALIERKDIDLEIRSTPIMIAIHSGFPNSARFHIAPENYNLEGYGIVPASGNSNYDYSITASVGDRNGNPVREATAVDFSSEIGGIVHGSALTDENGRASITLRPDGSRPYLDGFGDGFFNIYAKTVDEDNFYARDTLTMLFSTRHALIDLNPGTVDIPANGSQSFTYTVTDRNGNPMAAGTEISVEVADGLEAVGDVGFTLGDYLQPGPGSTEFGFTVSDIDDEDSNETGTSITIRVVAPSSGSETTLTVQGTRAKISRN